jgi:tellurite resistance protein
MAPRFKQALVQALDVSDATGRPSGRAIEPRLVAELALWSATVDGVVEPDEVLGLAELLRDLPGLEGFDDAEAQRTMDAMAATYATDDAIADRIAEISQAIDSVPLRRASYQLALWCAARDGKFTEDELDFLQALQDTLGISDEDADALLHATIEVAPLG